MSASFTNALPLIVIGLVLLAIAVWLILRVNQKTTVIGDDPIKGSGDGSIKRDVLDEGAAPAQRNQALIDAPAAVARNVGQTSANANSDMIAAASAAADAEAGAVVAPTKAPEPAPSPAPAPKSASSPAPAPASVARDDLTTIKGVGPKLVALLAEQGITSLAQIAAWSESDIAEIDAKLGRFKGRIARDQWVEQAKLLISDDKSAYSEKFGKNG